MDYAGEEFEALRLRVERLEREVATLRAAEGESSFAAAPPPLIAAASQAKAEVPIAARPSLEDRLGSQWFNRIAIAALLMGTAYGLKLAIDRGWLGEVGRTLIGLAAGTGLVLWSERFRLQGVRGLAYSLKAVGTGVLYLSLWAAFQLYHLLPGWAALGVMLLVTAWNAYMAWAQDAELLAAYALIGGMATPLLLSTGGNHEIFLFTYLLAIDASTALLIRLKGWPRLLLGIFPATVLYFIGWFSSYFRAEDVGVTALFLVLFGLTFVTVSIGTRQVHAHAEAVRSVKELDLTGILLPLMNAAFVALGLYSVLQDSGHHTWLAWLMLVLAAAYLGAMRLPQRAVSAAIHLSLAIVFLTIAIPLKASGHWITVAWLVEGVALFWVSMRVGGGLEEAADRATLREETVLRGLALAALGLGFVGVVAHLYWFTPRGFGEQADFFNHGLATALTGVAAFGGVAWLALTQRKTGSDPKGRSALMALVAVDLLGLLLTLREVVFSVSGTPFIHAEFARAMLGIAVLGAVTYEAGRIRQSKGGEGWGLLQGASAVALNVVAVLTGVREIASLWSNGAGVRDGNDALKQALAISCYLMMYSAMLLAVGFWKRTAFVRWQGLVLLVFTIAKTFLWDIGRLSQGYRVVSFLGLGALLMGVSFAYQKDWLSLRESALSGEEKH